MLSEEILRVRLAHARRIADRADVAEADAPDLAAREVLLELLLQRGRDLDARLLEELDLHDLGIRLARADVETRLEALALQEVTRHRCGQHAQVGDLDARRGQPGDHRALDHPAGGRRLAARGDARAALERGAERGGDAHRDLGSEVDVDEARDSVAAEQMRRRTRLPDDALVDVRPGFDVLVRIDPDARHDHALGADRHLVADRNALVNTHVRADVARPAEDGAFDQRAPADVRRRVDHRTGRARAFPQRHAVREHGVRADRRPRRDAAVVADVGRALDLLEIADLDALSEPHVAADANAGNVELDVLLERIEVRLPELVEVPDVLPVAVHHVPVQRASHLEQVGKELFREVERAVRRDVLQHLRLQHVDARC